MLTGQRQWFCLVAGVLCGGLLGLVCWRLGLAAPACWCAFTAGVCAVWWVTEALPLPATALLPFVVFPLTGVLDHREVASGYGHTSILLLLGGFLLSAAMESTGVHRRLALSMVRVVGGQSGPRLVLGFMLATALLSMWISNTATALMMLPIALAVLQQADSPQLRPALLLGIAYSASVGGMATPVGTPPNVLFIANYSELTGKTVGFVEWGRVAVPIVCVLLPSVWLIVGRRARLDRHVVMPEVGRWRPCERRVMVVFVLTALAWIFLRSPFGGWVALVGAVDDQGRALVGDATVALAASLALFIIPRGDSVNVPSSASPPEVAPPCPAPTRLLDWDTAVKIPWGVLLLFGGGLVLADGFQSTGLSERIGQSLSLLSDLPPLVVILLVCLLVNFMTELTSSTATTALLLPILGQTAIAADMPPALLMIPGTIAASCAFMLPVATPPNTIVFGAGGLDSGMMARRGFVLNLWSTLVISLIGYWMLGGG